ncbi:MAG: Undecaprenyl-phosphate 4-deoxy-4-formamido-L-arabinose transferase [Myxococcota bacterium]|nr:Undecaprenyl-phosphate 4-deoxy-4-formamido-L-arabinose transferase [Myxococcota bacterium]
MSGGLSIVIPAYNEEQGLRDIVRETVEAAERAAPEFEIIIVNDGSSDGTGAIADGLAKMDARIRVVHHERNRGSGMAIRTGAAAARMELVMYVPADGQFELSEIGAYVNAARDADIVIGARMSREDYSAFRLASSRTFIFLCNRLFDQNFRDVNWVHLWRREIFGQISPKSEGVFFLEEVLVRARRKGRRIVEIDSAYHPRRSGKAKGAHPKTIVKTIIEMARLWREPH